MAELNHIFLEVYCLCNTEENRGKDRPEYCPGRDEEAPVPGYLCLCNGCPFWDFTSCENTACFINEHSEMDYGILFDSELEAGKQTVLKEIVKRKIDEAYEEFLQTPPA